MPLEEHGLSNGYDPELTQSLVAEIERIDAEQQSAKGSYMNQCRHFNAGRKAVYDRAKDQGVSLKSLKATVKDRKLERKRHKLREDMEADELEDFERFQASLGDYASTPLGAAAVERVRPQSHAAA